MLGENAFLLDVSAPGPVDGYGDNSGPGAVLWSGRVAAHLRRRRQLEATTSRGGMSQPIGSTLVEVDQLIVRTARGAPARLLKTAGDRETGQTVLVEDRRTGESVQRRFRVAGVDLRAGATIADSLLITLGDGDL